VFTGEVPGDYQRKLPLRFVRTYERKKNPKAAAIEIPILRKNAKGWGTRRVTEPPDRSSKNLRITGRIRIVNEVFRRRAAYGFRDPIAVAVVDNCDACATGRALYEYVQVRPRTHAVQLRHSYSSLSTFPTGDALALHARFRVLPLPRRHS
jgi:hypothetical protein